LKNTNKCSIIALHGSVNDERVVGGMDGRTEDKLKVEMTNEEYRVELGKMFKSVDDNRILRYFYIYI
jgi:hypothetical protein